MKIPEKSFFTHIESFIVFPQRREWSRFLVSGMVGEGLLRFYEAEELD